MNDQTNPREKKKGAKGRDKTISPVVLIPETKFIF
jgi:hypothetical protein